jgi:hypothetical protein
MVPVVSVGSTTFPYPPHSSVGRSGLSALETPQFQTRQEK